MFLVKRIIGITCAKYSKNTFKFVKIIHGRLGQLFSGHGVHTLFSHTGVTHISVFIMNVTVQEIIYEYWKTLIIRTHLIFAKLANSLK